MFLLDTNVVSEPARPRPNRDVLTRIDEHSGDLAIPSVVWHELWFGVERLTDGRRRQYLRAYLTDVVAESFDVIPYDKRAARWHARERARLTSEGRTPPFVDGQIAAIAAVENMVLVTRNTRDFDAFHGVQVENWFS